MCWSLLLLSAPDATPAPRHLDIFRAWVERHETESRGPNRSPLIDYIIKRIGLPLGSPYCAASWAYALDSAGATSPRYRGGLAQGYRVKGSIDARDVLAGRVTISPGALGGFRKGTTIYGHLFGVERQISRSTFVTLEANTSPGAGGSQRDGDGFYRRTRVIRPYDYFRITFFVPVRYG